MADLYLILGVMQLIAAFYSALGGVEWGNCVGFLVLTTDNEPSNPPVNGRAGPWGLCVGTFGVGN